jgi:hypothetical protein
MAKTRLNTPNGNRDWSGEQRAEGGKLETLIKTTGGDLEKLRAAGWGVDSCGQWFRLKDQLLVPSPEANQSGILRLAEPI